MITSNKNPSVIQSMYVEHPSVIQSTALLVFFCFLSDHPTSASKATSNIFNKYIELEIENPNKTYGSLINNHYLVD